MIIINLLLVYPKLKKRIKFKERLIKHAGKEGNRCYVGLFEKKHDCSDSCLLCDLKVLKEHSIESIIEQLLDYGKYGDYYFDFLYDTDIENSIGIEEIESDKFKKKYIKDLEDMI